MPAQCTGILALPGERDHSVAARFAFALQACMYVCMQNNSVSSTEDGRLDYRKGS